MDGDPRYVSWIVIGSLVGFVASRVVGIHGWIGRFGLVCVGMGGAALGRILLGWGTGRQFSDPLDPVGLVAAVVGAVVLLAVWLPFGLHGEDGTVFVPPTKWWERIRFSGRDRPPPSS